MNLRNSSGVILFVQIYFCHKNIYLHLKTLNYTFGWAPNLAKSDYVQNICRAILFNKDVNRITNGIIAKLLGEYKIDNRCNSVKDKSEGELDFTTEYLNSTNNSDFQSHELKLNKTNYNHTTR